ncbi:MAG: carbohydrate-binding domain-containing protein [Lachnospiraceae bacterium]|nr:carbohydrate-binding domain-containing protein [Lachnospiraceae bacterium]
MVKRVITFLSFVLFAAAFLCACRYGSEDTEITFSGDKVTVKGAEAKSVIVTDSSVTITRSGTYQLSGTGKMQVIVDTEGGKAVYLNLNGVNLTCDSSSPVWIKNAPLVCINLKAESQNTITDRHLYTPPEEDAEEQSGEQTAEDIPSAAIYSRAPLLIDGEGKLTVNAQSYNGISTSDTFTMKSGNLSITAEHHGIKGRDYVVISGGTLNVKCEGDGIKSTNTEKASLGYVNITGGMIILNADDEGIYAPSSVSASGATIMIKSKKTSFLTLGKLYLSGCSIDINTDKPPFSAAQSDIRNNLITVNGQPYTP